MPVRHQRRLGRRSVDSGVLRLWRNRRLRLPLSKTRTYLLMVSLATLATLISSMLDHARVDFENPWIRLPVAVGIFGTVVPAGLATLRTPSRFDILTCFIEMPVGVMGLLLHIGTDLTAGGTIVIERVLRGAPFLAPLLFANMGLIGLIAVLNPTETR